MEARTEVEFRALVRRARGELAGPEEAAGYERLLALVRDGLPAGGGGSRRVRPPGAEPGPDRVAAGHAVPASGESPRSASARDELASVLTRPGCPLWAREVAAFALGCAGDQRAFETLVLLLNHRDPPRCATAAHALARLGDSRTARVAAALATNPLRTAYALHAVRLLIALRAPESVPALIATLERLLASRSPHWRIALACVEGLGALADDRASPILTDACRHPRLAFAASAALARLPGHRSP